MENKNDISSENNQSVSASSEVHSAGKKILSRIPKSQSIIIAAVALWGCLAIYASRAFGEEPYFYVERQIRWLVIGSGLFIVSSLIPFRFFKKAAPYLMLLSIGGLAAVLAIGVEHNGMRGWLKLPGGYGLQVSEFAKVFFILYLSVNLKKNTDSFVWNYLLSCTVCGLVIVEPDFGSATLIYSVFFVMLFIAGGTLKQIIFTIVTALIAGLWFIIKNPYAFDRIMSFISPDSYSLTGAWHIRQFQFALAQGGYFGSGSKGAVWSNAYLPLAHSDSMYATIVETSGAIGGIIVIAAFVFLFYRCSAGALDATLERTARLFILGCGGLYFIQAMLHISVNVVLLPPTGVTLPFLSYGGSSLMSTLLAFGIVMSALRSRKNNYVRGCL